MKKLLKFLLIFILVIILIAGGIVIGVYVSLGNDTDDTPIGLYKADADKSEVISTVLSEGFDLHTKNYIDITLNEEELNVLIFCIIREKLNENYLPVASDTADYTDSKNYIWASTLDSSVPLVGGKGIIIKSLYAKISDGQLKLYMPALIGKKASCIELYVSFEESDDAFFLKIDTLKVGKINYAGKGSKKVLSLATKMGLKETDLEAKLSTDELKVDVDLQNLKIGVTKDSLSAFLTKVITDNIESRETTRATLVSLADMITSKENDILDLGVFVNRFGVRCDLAKADVDDSQLILNPEYSEFNEPLYITTVTQNLAISNIASTDPKINISETDFNAMIFAKSNGYANFMAEFEIPNTDASIRLAITGIDVDLNADRVLIDVILDLNGLKTLITLGGNVSGNNTNQISITLDDTIKIGEGLSEATKSYILASSDFIKEILAEKISEIEMMEYDEATNSLIISGDNFNEMLEVEGGGILPMQVNRLCLTEDSLDVYVTITNPLITASLDIVSHAVSDFLESSGLSAADFDTADPAEEAAVNEVLAQIAASGDAISAGNITEEDTANLIEAIQGLSDGNKEVIFNSIEDSMISDDLLNLYDSLFGK
ncbi:MAG: hypothetical protein J6X93_06640 [Bacilli bacterium]|nr:hypothetical protein [Bacilli bacterium]